MGVYIKISGNRLILAGTVASEEMIADGYQLYEGEIPQASSLEFLMWDEETEKIIENVEFRKRKELENIRSRRNKLLEESDWTSLRSLDTGEVDQQWVDYRNALRDLPQNYVLGEELEWPRNPNDPIPEPEVVEEQPEESSE